MHWTVPKSSCRVAELLSLNPIVRLASLALATCGESWRWPWHKRRFLAHCVILELAKNVSKLARAQNVIEAQRRVVVVVAVERAVWQVYVRWQVPPWPSFNKCTSLSLRLRPFVRQAATSTEKLDSAAYARYSLPAHSTKGCAFLYVYRARVKYIVLFFSYLIYLQVRTVKNTRESKQSRESETQKKCVGNFRTTQN